MKTKYISGLIIMILFAGGILNSANSQEENMKKEALEKMRAWSSSIGDEQFKKLGYKDMTEFNSADLGKAYVLYTIDPYKLVEFTPEGIFRDLLGKAGYVVYPVISGEKNKSLLWMYQRDNEWKIARVGSAGISESLKRSEAVIAKGREEYRISAREKPMMVRIYQLYFDFMYVGGEEDEYIVPFTSLPELNIRANTFYPVKSILPILQREMKSKMPFKDAEGRIKEY